MARESVNLRGKEKEEVFQKLRRAGITFSTEPIRAIEENFIECLDMAYSSRQNPHNSNHLSPFSSDNLFEIWPKDRGIILYARYDPKWNVSGKGTAPIVPYEGYFNVLFPGECYQIHHRHPEMERDISSLRDALFKIKGIERTSDK